MSKATGIVKPVVTIVAAILGMSIFG